MESAFAAQLRTNYVPSSSEVQEIRNLVSRPLEERARLEDKIARFQVIIDDLCDQRDKLDAHIQDHLALVSGARRLPHDVVQEIFCHCLPTDRNAVMSATEAPLLLGRICSGWRKIALSTPDLWATLHVSIPNCQVPSHYRKWRQIAEAAKTWLVLSGGLPLSLSTTYSTVIGKQPDRKASLGITYFLNILTHHSRRWEHIDFTFPLPEFATAVATLTEADVPLLKSVILESSVYNDIELANQWPLISILNTPTLREISIVSFKHTDYIQPLPWGQLTGLYLEHGIGPWGDTISETEALSILKKCPMLIKCKLLVESDPVSPLPQPISHEVTLPFLRSLILVEGTEAALTAQFFDCLKVPALNYLGFRRFSISHVSHLPFALTTLFTRENQIEELEIGLESFQAATLRECLYCAKKIKRLTLSGPERLWGYPPDPALTDHLLYLLTPASDKDLLCPSLEEITLRSCQELSDEKILLFLQERTNPTHIADGMTVLKRATITVNRVMETDILPDVQPLITAGLKLDLEYIPPIFEEDTEVVEVPTGPKLRVSYVSWVPYDVFSPFRGLRTRRMMNTLN